MKKRPISTILKSTFLFFGIFLLIWSCQTENELVENNSSNFLEELQSHFNPESFNKALPYDFEVVWNNPLKQYSEDLESFYYEFPIAYTSKFNPDDISKTKKQKSEYSINYKLLVTENEEQIFEYYIIRFYQENSKSFLNSQKSFADTSGFTGFIHLLNKNGDVVYAKKIMEDITDDNKFYNKNFKDLRNENLFSRVDETCLTVTTYHYIDWYNKDQNGNMYYTGTSYEGFTTDEICESNWLPYLNTSGGGGAGLYKNSGDGGVYNSCSGSECKYQLDDAEIEVVVVAPDNPIKNMVQFLWCLDIDTPTTLTIYADQPTANSSLPTNSNLDPGHAFVSLTQNGNTVVFGFYPEKKAKAAFLDTGAMGNDQNHEYDASISVNITPEQVLSIIEYAVTPPEIYNINHFNCTDYVIEIGNKTGLNLPNCYTPLYPGGGGSAPSVLGQYIRNLPQSNDYSTSTITNNAPSQSGDCN